VQLWGPSLFSPIVFYPTSDLGVSLPREKFKLQMPVGEFCSIFG